MGNTNAETIRDFLISLGFEVDGAGEKKFSAIIAGVTGNVLKLGAAVEGAALAVVGFTAQVASGLDRLYWQAQRTGGAAEQIKSLGYAVSQAGGSVEGLNSSLEGVAKFLRNNPGGEGFLRNMGIQTRDTNGNLHDTASLVALIGERLSALPTYRANQYANILGIDENTLMAMRRGVGEYVSDYQMITKALGYDPEIAAKHANAFMTEFSRFGVVIRSAKEKVGGELARILTPSVEKFTKLILKHWPTIEKVIMSVVDAIMTLSEILGQVVFRGAKGIQDLIGWWKKLDEGSKDLIKTFGLVLAAWWALNTGFLTSPIGIITTLLAALFLLYDDYQTWKDGGKSFIDWSKWEGTLTKFSEGIEYVLEKLNEFKEWFKNTKIGKWFTDANGELDLLKTAFAGFATYIAVSWVGQILGAFGKIGKGLKGIGKLAAAAIIIDSYTRLEDIREEAKASGVDVGTHLYNKVKENEKNAEPLFESFGDAWDWVTNGGKYAKKEVEKSQERLTRGERNNNPLNIEFAKQRGATVETHPERRFAKFNTAYDGLERTAWQLRRYFNGLTDNVKRQSVDLIVRKWAPPGGKDKNRTEDYIDRVAQRLGVGRHDRLDLNNHNMMYALMNAMSQEEIGKPLPYDTRLIMAAIKGQGDPTKALAKNSFNFDLSALENGVANINNMLGNVDPKMFDNAMANANNMMSHTGYTPERLQLLANNQPNQTTVSPVYNITVNGVESPHEAAALTGETVQRNTAILVRNLQTKIG
ncbi:lytic transglycosylase catalytic [Xenorhabdus sp. TS4]|uniref:lytic transglycosylase catalytic n=1 Tax=Xenorhabdus sp. TS4 TaxID=1873483 RepID=UPI001657169B|nr:lytic transglycosylase catalytic [Xenorhabdus sp. TS4]MBC8950255.1 putative bacteriophage protein [Xenorhabdus sp. TS4]